VNIDKQTTEVFVKEMMKRYSRNVKREAPVDRSSPPAKNPWNDPTHTNTKRPITITNPLMPKPEAMGDGTF
jgi:hypothetical protein